MIAQGFRYSAVEAGVGNSGRLELGPGRGGPRLVCSRWRQELLHRHRRRAVVETVEGLRAEAEARAHEGTQVSEFEILVDLREGAGRAAVATCDLTAQYVRINADCRS